MDSTDIPYDTLHTIFITPQKINKEVVDIIIEWNQSLDPSFGMVRNQVGKFFAQDPNNAISACDNVLNILKMLADAKCPRLFMRAFLANVKNIYNGNDSPAKDKLILKKQEYRQKWLTVPSEVLEPYFDAFSLKQTIPKQQINEFINELIVTKKYNNCLDFIKFLGIKDNKVNIEKLVGKMSTKRDASKAADYVKSLKLNPKDYPALGQRLYKNTARHFLTKHGWEYAEQIFQQNPEVLACIVEDLIFKNKISQAKSIWSRHKLEGHLQKQEAIQFFNQLKQQNKKEILPNYLYIDSFGPSNEDKYFCLKDFGIKEQDVIWVDKQSENLKEILSDIQSAEMLGIDTQSIVGQTKFQKTDEAAIIQISTLKKIYIFDGFNCNHPDIAQTIQKCFNNQLIIGHSFTNDTEGIARALGIKNKQLPIKNLLDICKVYKCLNINSRYSSLAHICNQVLGKQLSKEQTLTNWQRRPLRRNQIHYAALDAQIVLQIYKKWAKQYGQMLHYYAELDSDSL